MAGENVTRSSSSATTPQASTHDVNGASLQTLVDDLETGATVSDSQNGNEDEKDREGNAQGPQSKDPNLVDWEGPGDLDNPQNMGTARKWTVTMVLSTLTIWVTFSSSIFSQATFVTADEFNVSTEVMLLGTSLPVFGFAFGPLIWGPLSELYGRKIALFVGYTVFAIFQIPVAVGQDVQTVLVSRFFTGFFGCAPLAVIGGILADIWNPVDRGIAVALFAAATFCGPTLGPIVGGFVVDSRLGWRWTAWLTLIPSAFFGLVAVFVVPETYPPVLLTRRATRLRFETRNWALHCLHEEHPPSSKDIVVQYFFRPIHMLLLEPILACVTLYLALVYGILYLTYEAFPMSFRKVRGWNKAGVATLPFLGILVGVFLGLALIIILTKTRFVRRLKEHGSVVPEERLPPMIIGGIMLPIGLFWFGWASHTHWFAQVVAAVPIGLGIMVIFMQGLSYIIDMYLMFANSALAAQTLVRSLLGGAFPMFSLHMYGKLGVDWASSLLGFLTVAMIPFPILFYVYGAKLRSMSRYKPRL